MIYELQHASCQQAHGHWLLAWLPPGGTIRAELSAMPRRIPCPTVLEGGMNNL